MNCAILLHAQFCSTCVDVVRSIRAKSFRSDFMTPIVLVPVPSVGAKGFADNLSCYCFHHFLVIFDKNTDTHTPMNKMQLKSIEEKMSKISALTHYHIIIFKSKVHRKGIQTTFSWRFILGNVYIFLPFGTHSECLAQFFNVRVRAVSWLMQWKITVDFLFWDRLQLYD